MKADKKADKGNPVKKSSPPSSSPEPAKSPIVKKKSTRAPKADLTAKSSSVKAKSADSSSSAATPKAKAAAKKTPSSKASKVSAKAPAPVKVSASAKSTAVARARLSVKKPASPKLVSSAKAPASTETPLSLKKPTSLLKPVSLQSPVEAETAKSSKPAPSVKSASRASKVKKAATPLKETSPAEPDIQKSKPSRPRKPVNIPPILFEGDNAPAPAPSGPGTRYTLTSTPLERKVETPTELPESYGTGRLFLTARDPHWLYASWDFTREQQARCNAQSRTGALVLRISTHGTGETPVQEIKLHPESKNWFAHVPRAETFYSAELGFYDQSSRWHSVAESRRTFTPPDDVAADSTTEFATIPPQIPFEKLLETVQKFASENQELAQAIIQLETQEQQAQEFGGSSISRDLAAALNSSAKVDGVSAPVQFIQSARRPQPESWTPEQAAQLEQLVHMDRYRRVWMGSLEITELIRRRLEKEISSIAAAELARRGELAPEMGGIPSISSPLEAAPSRARGFWYKVNAELIIYGATEPGATVTIGGRQINLRSDGSFSYRFALPDGRFELPTAAISPDREETRQAILRFSRFSEFHGDVEAHPQNSALKSPAPENI